MAWTKEQIAAWRQIEWAAQERAGWMQRLRTVAAKYGASFDDIREQDIEKLAVLVGAPIDEIKPGLSYAKLELYVTRWAMAQRASAKPPAAADPAADDGYLSHRNAVAMLRLTNKTAKEKSRYMEAIRQRAGTQLRCRKAGNRWEYHAGDWQHVVDTIRGMNRNNAADDESGLLEYTDPTPGEIEAEKRRIRNRE